MNLDEIRARVEQATPGPWTADVRLGCLAVHAGAPLNCLAGAENDAIAYQHGHGELGDAGYRLVTQQQETDAEFIAHAREDVPALLGLVADLVATLAHQRARADALTLSHLDRRDSRVNVLRLLEGGVISVGKACQALNEIADGRATLSPPPIAPDANEQGLSWKDRAEQAEARLDDLLRKRRWLNVTPEDTAVVMLPEATYARLVEALESGLALLPTFDAPAVWEAWKAQAWAALAKVEGRA